MNWKIWFLWCSFVSFFFFYPTYLASPQPSQMGEAPHFVNLSGRPGDPVPWLVGYGMWPGTAIEPSCLGHWPKGHEGTSGHLFNYSQQGVQLFHGWHVPTGSSISEAFPSDCLIAWPWPCSCCPANLSCLPFSESGSPVFPLTLWTYSYPPNNFFFH